MMPETMPLFPSTLPLTTPESHCPVGGLILGVDRIGEQVVEVPELCGATTKSISKSHPKRWEWLWRPIITTPAGQLAGVSFLIGRSGPELEPQNGPQKSGSRLCATGHATGYGQVLTRKGDTSTQITPGFYTARTIAKCGVVKASPASPAVQETKNLPPHAVCSGCSRTSAEQPLGCFLSSDKLHTENLLHRTA